MGELNLLPADAGNGLTTERLVLRRYTLDDLPDLIALNRDPDVMRYLGGPVDERTSEAMLRGRILQYYGDHPGLGVWATCLRGSGEIIGFHLLNHVQGETLIQVGYRLHRRHWGRGYATEMAMALLRYGYVRLGLSTLMATALPGNTASQHVLLKCGLHRAGERFFPHPAYAPFGVLAYFERARAEWLAEFSPADLVAAPDGTPT